jgi:hypothetical protein
MKRTALPVMALPLALLVTVGANAQLTSGNRPHAESLRPGMVVSTPPARPHVVVGTILRVTGSSLVVELRTRRLLHVDASTAIASGRYSQPLFVGKFVIIEGSYGRDGTLFANSITRLPRIDSESPQDR